MNAQAFLDHLHAARSGIHTLFPPAPAEEFDTLALKCGSVPQFITYLWSNHNGVEYCVRSMPLLWFFPIRPNPQDLWATNQSITEYTEVWRQFGDRSRDWAIGTWNDGRFIILSEGNIIEWDSSHKRKVGDTKPVEEWMDLIVREGDTYLEGY